MLGFRDVGGIARVQYHPGFWTPSTATRRAPTHGAYVLLERTEVYSMRSEHGE